MKVILVVKEGATIGANATIICGNTIGKYAFVGAGAVITKGVPAHALVYGNPAQLQGWVCERGVKFDFAPNIKASCPRYGKIYYKKSERQISGGEDGHK